MFKEHGLYPDNLGELLSASINGQKIVTLSDLDVRSDSFIINVKGLPIRIEGLMRLLRSRHEIDPRTFSVFQDVLARDNPLLIREVIRWKPLVDSVREYDRDGNPAKISIGKAVLLETLTQWYGVFDLDDPDTIKIFNDYIGRA